MHEHDTVHELDAAVAAGSQHFSDFRCIAAAGLLAHDMLAGRGCAEYPLFAHAGRQRYIDGINVVTADELLVVHWLRRMREGRGGLAVGDELFGSLATAAADGHERRIAGVADGVPVFAGDVRGPQNSKT